MAITKILNIQAADDRNPSAHLKNAIEYIQNPDKTEECVLVGSINCLPDTAFEQMMETKELYHKTGKRQGYHIIISFSPEEIVTPEQALYVVEHFAKDVLGDDYEAVYAVHTDKERMHAHLIWNSVSLVTGKKYNSPKGNWKNKLQPITNKYCKELGLTICPAEYSKNPVNMTRDEWQKEQEFKEFIFRDAQFCALSAGSVEHFEFLMKKLGYEFQQGKYLRVRIPGRKIYHRLDKMHEMFEEGKLKHWVNMPWSAKPYFYTNNPRKIYRAEMSEYQKRYYAKMYRMRVIEHRRFDYKSAHYAEELRKFHRLQDEYLLLVKNDIKDIYGLLVFMENKKSVIKTIDDRHHEIYKENQKRKRKIATPEDMREYQSWHLSVEAELTELKEAKKKEKYDYKLAGNVLGEKTYSVQAVGLENEVVMDVNEVVMPEYAEVHGEEDDRTENVRDEYAQMEYVPVRSDRVEHVNMGSAKNEEFDIAVVTERHEEENRAVLKDVISEEGDLDKEPDGDTFGPAINQYVHNAEQSYNFSWGSEEITARNYSDVETEDFLQVKDVDDVVVADLAETLVSSVMEFGEDAHFPQSYTEYMSLVLEKRAELQGITDEKNVADIFSVVKRNFDNAGYNVSFDKKYDEAMTIERYIAERKSVDRTEVIADKLKDYEPYENISSSIKAEVFGFSIDDSSSNLKLYMQVMKKLGVRMGQEEMLEDYQKVYEETMKRQDEYNKPKEKEWKHGRVR